MSGTDLATMICEGDLTDCERAVAIVLDVAAGVAHCHAHGTVHGDIKPGNVMVEESTGRSVLIDFGLGSPAGAVRGMAVGTPGFVEPMILDDDQSPITEAADIYALGALLHAVFTAETPFDGYTPVGTLRRQLTGECHIGTSIPRPYADVIRKACQYEPGDRYQTVEEFTNALTAAQAATEEE